MELCCPRTLTSASSSRVPTMMSLCLPIPRPSTSTGPRGVIWASVLGHISAPADGRRSHPSWRWLFLRCSHDSPECESTKVVRVRGKVGISEGSRLSRSHGEQAPGSDGGCIADRKNQRSTAFSARLFHLQASRGSASRRLRRRGTCREQMTGVVDGRTLQPPRAGHRGVAEGPRRTRRRSRRRSTPTRSPRRLPGRAPTTPKGRPIHRTTDLGGPRATGRTGRCESCRASQQPGTQDLGVQPLLGHRPGLVAIRSPETPIGRPA